MSTVNSRGTGVFSRRVHGRLSTEFREALDGTPGVTALRRVGERPRLLDYLREIWDRRLFTYAGAMGHASTQFSNDRLGSLWLIVRPLLDAAFYYVIFALLLNVSRGMDNFVAWLLVGLFTFQITSRCIGSAATLIRSSKSLIRAFAFPRASLAISLVMREMVQSVPALGVMVILIMSLPPHALPTLHWLAVLLLLPLQLMFTLGLVLLFARLGAALPDFARLMSFVTRVLMYASGVIIPVERFITNDTIGAIINANPVYVMLNMYRALWIDGVMPGVGDWLYLAAWAVGAAVVGLLVFWRAEETYGQE